MSVYLGKDKVSVTGYVEKGIVPTGEIEITENGRFDVKDFASASVNVSGIELIRTDEVNVASYKNYDDYIAFWEDYGGYKPRHDEFLIINYINNTNNNRAGISALYIDDRMMITNRVGSLGQGSNYGLDVYSGCTIKFNYYKREW